MTLNAKLWTWQQWLWTSELRSDDDSKMHEWAWKMALNAKLRKIVNQNAWMGTKNGSERQVWRKNGDGTGCEYETTVPNIKLRMNDGSERLKCKCGFERQMGNEQWLWTPTKSMTLNARMKQWLWMPNWRWWRLWTPNWNNGSKRQMENERWHWTPNGKRAMW